MTDKMPDDRLYGHTNARELEPHFMNHLMAMTSENLHSKSDIACELAYRDMLIQKHAEEIAALRKDEVVKANKIINEVLDLLDDKTRNYAMELIKQRISDE